MTETPALALAWMAGAMLGAIFFGGLWWTVRKCASCERPGLWFAGSLLLRMSIALGGFYFVSAGSWQRLLLCLVGFIMARLIVTWLIRPPEESQRRAAPQASHAP
jgi:F1F0 ATPase subunit 2